MTKGFRTIGGWGFILLFSAVFVFGPATARAGWKLVAKQDDETSASYVDGDRLLSLQSEKFRIIKTPKQMLMISDQHKTYWKGSPDQYKKEMCEMTKDAWAQMDYKPPQIPDPKVTVEKIGPAKMAGYQVEGYRVIADGTPYREIWVNRDSRLKSLDRAWKKLEDKKPGFAWACGLPAGKDEKIESTRAYRRITASGYVFYEKSLDSAVYHPETVAVEKAQVPAEKFELPSGYRQLAFKAFFQQGGSDEEESARPAERQQMMEQARERAMEPDDSAGEATKPATVTPPASSPSTAAAREQREAERARWGKKAPEPEDEPEGVEDTIKKGVKGLFKSIF